VMPATNAKAVASVPSAAAAPSTDASAVPPSPVTADKKSEENRVVAKVDKGQEATNKVVSEPLQPAKVDTKSVASKAPVKAPSAVAAEPASVTTAKPDASRAQALLDGKDSPAKVVKVDAPKAPATQPPVAVPEGRFIVQVGAYADNAHAHEVRLKLEHVGLKTYAQAVDTKDGKRIRVRVGPFTTKAEADKAAEKIKKLNLPAALLTL
jgi:DedD protein